MKHRGPMWISIILALFFVVGLMYVAVTSDKKTSSGSGTIDPISFSDWMKGSPLAKTTLIEYSDLQCPACRSYYPVMKKIEKEFGPSVQIVFRHYPLEGIHKNALGAAYATEAAGKQGKFWEMHDRLFEEQDQWSELADPKEKFREYAKQIQLSVEQFEKDMASDEIKDRVRRTIKNATDAGIDSTPTFYLNGEKLKNPRGYEPFAEAIRKSQGK